MAPAPLHQISVFHSATHNQIGPLWCWFPSGWACACSRLLWFSPTTSPVRLGVSPAVAPTTTGIFNQRLASVARSASLPPSLWSICVQMWGRRAPPAALLALPSTTQSPALSVYLCTNVGPRGQTACPVHPTLRQSWSCHSNTSPLRPVPVSAPPTALDVCLFFISLVSDFLAVQFSVSSGCARRRSVSTYAAMLVLPNHRSFTEPVTCSWVDNTPF